jgi:hypothetical protein
MEPKSLRDAIARLEELASAKGRGRLPVTLIGALPHPEVLSRYQDIGVDRCVFWQLPRERTALLARLDDCAVLMKQMS